MVSEENLKERELTKLGTYTAADGTVTTTDQFEGETVTGTQGNPKEQFVQSKQHSLLQQPLKLLCKHIHSNTKHIKQTQTQSTSKQHATWLLYQNCDTIFKF